MTPDRFAEAAYLFIYRDNARLAMTPDRFAEAAYLFIYRDNARLAMDRAAARCGIPLHPASVELLAFLKSVADHHDTSTNPAPTLSETGSTMGPDDVMSTAQIAAELDVTPQWAASLLRAGPLKDCSWRSEKGRGRPRQVRRRDFEEWRRAC
jgi:hypothetical protein